MWCNIFATFKWNDTLYGLIMGSDGWWFWQDPACFKAQSFVHCSLFPFCTCILVIIGKLVVVSSMYRLFIFWCNIYGTSGFIIIYMYCYTKYTMECCIVAIKHIILQLKVTSRRSPRELWLWIFRHSLVSIVQSGNCNNRLYGDRSFRHCLYIVSFEFSWNGKQKVMVGRDQQYTGVIKALPWLLLVNEPHFHLIFLL